MDGFAEIEHTADIGIEIWADSVENLFSSAVQGYYKLALSSDYLCKKHQSFRYSDQDSICENLLISFLSEINYLLMVKKQIVKPIKSIQISKKNENYNLIVNGQLQMLDYPKNDIQTEIKAVTYHQIKIRKENGIFRTRVIFDI